MQFMMRLGQALLGIVLSLCIGAGLFVLLGVVKTWLVCGG